LWSGFDFVIARFLVQHLSSVQAFLTRVAALLPEGGHVLVYDANDDATRLHPEVPERAAAFAELARAQRQAAVGRDAVREVERAAWRHGFAVVSHRQLAHPAESDSDKRALFSVFADIFGVGPYLNLGDDAGQALAGIEHWAALPSSFGQFATQAVLLRKQSAGVYTRSRRVPSRR
jgi:hypothetical protein